MALDPIQNIKNMDLKRELDIQIPRLIRKEVDAKIQSMVEDFEKEDLSINLAEALDVDISDHDDPLACAQAVLQDTIELEKLDGVQKTIYNAGYIKALKDMTGIVDRSLKDYFGEDRR